MVYGAVPALVGGRVRQFGQQCARGFLKTAVLGKAIGGDYGASAAESHYRVAVGRSQTAVALAQGRVEGALGEGTVELHAEDVVLSSRPVAHPRRVQGREDIRRVLDHGGLRVIQRSQAQAGDCGGVRPAVGLGGKDFGLADILQGFLQVQRGVHARGIQQPIEAPPGLRKRAGGPGARIRGVHGADGGGIGAPKGRVDARQGIVGDA